MAKKTVKKRGNKTTSFRVGRVRAFIMTPGAISAATADRRGILSGTLLKMPNALRKVGA